MPSSIEGEQQQERFKKSTLHREAVLSSVSYGLAGHMLYSGFLGNRNDVMLAGGIALALGGLLEYSSLQKGKKITSEKIEALNLLTQTVERNKLINATKASNDYLKSNSDMILSGVTKVLGGAFIGNGHTKRNAAITIFGVALFIFGNDRNYSPVLRADKSINNANEYIEDVKKLRDV